MDYANIFRYYVYMNYAKKGGRRVAIVDPPEKKSILPKRKRPPTTAYLRLEMPLGL
jgi:hypothetical protein